MSSDISEDLRHIGGTYWRQLLRLPGPIRYGHDLASISVRMDVTLRVGPLLAEWCRKFVRRVAVGHRKKSILIVFSMQIVVPDQMRTALLRTIGSILEPTRVAPGCLSAHLYAELDKRKTLLLVEEWGSRDQFERNLDAEKLNAIVAAIELSSEAPVVRVDTVEREEGVDTLALHRSVVGGGIR
jgi:quinol monooxygenase YgiN